MEDLGPLLRQALPYIKHYRNKRFVIKLGGEVVVRQDRRTASRRTSRCFSSSASAS